MMWYVVSRALYEKRWFMAGWALAYGVMSTLILMFFPSFSESGGFDTVAATLPQQLQGFIGDPRTFSSLDGFIVTQVYDIRMSLLLIIMTIVLAVGLTVREEEAGDLRALLATPIGRVRLSIEKLLAASIIIGVLCLASTVGVYIGIAALGESAPHVLLWQAYALSVLFGAAVFSVPFAIGLATGKRSVTLAISLTLAIGGYLLSTFARAVDWLTPWEPLSVIYYYDTAPLRDHSFAMWNVWALAGFILCLITVGVLLFRQRDIT